MPIKNISVHTTHQGLFEITKQITAAINEIDIQEGLCTLFIQHTSASLVIQEDSDPPARRDLERWLNRLVPVGDFSYTHTLEGADDMPAHIKSALTATNLAIPILDGQLALGTRQGIFLWEHHHYGELRSIIIHIGN